MRQFRLKNWSLTHSRIRRLQFRQEILIVSGTGEYFQSDIDSWTSYNATVTDNTVSFTFDDPVSFKAVTASAAGATLTIEDINPAGSSILVYPNPTANRIYIQADTNLKAELFDLMGRKIRSTNQSQIDISNLSGGNYILQVKTQNTTQSFKIIKQ